MGLYLNHSRISTTRKASALIEHYGAEEVFQPTAWPAPETKVYICVVENGPFDVAAIIFDAREFDEFTLSDLRRQTWLLMDKGIVFGLNPSYKEYL